MTDQLDTELDRTELYLSPEKDELFEKGPWPKPFVFNSDVVCVFDDMVSRSIPLYREVLACAAHESGFDRVDSLIKLHNFISLVALKQESPHV